VTDNSQETIIQYRVPYADTDQMGFVYYANYFVYFERLRNELLRSSGVPYRDWEKRGLILPVVEAHAEYRSPAHYDDLLEVKGWVSELGKVRLRIDYEILRGSTILVRGYTIHACLDREGKPTRVPEEIAKLGDIAAGFRVRRGQTRR
jgi:acyl-CoA thioester hydrolase